MEPFLWVCLLFQPCTMCAAGVLECLPLAAAYGLDDIYRKSLRWITKYFVRIWPTKGFASLPRELIDKCYQQHVVHMVREMFWILQLHRRCWLKYAIQRKTEIMWHLLPIFFFSSSSSSSLSMLGFPFYLGLSVVSFFPGWCQPHSQPPTWRPRLWLWGVLTWGVGNT